MPPSLIAVLGLAVLLVAPPAVVAVSARSLAPASLPEWKAGYRWVYRTDRGGTIAMEVLAEETLDGVRVWRLSEGPVFVYLSRESLSFVARTDRKGRIVETARPDAATYRWPLAPESAWKAPFTWTREGTAQQEPGEVRVVGLERVEVPAGTFETFHVVHQWKSFRREYWYAPAARFPARIRVSGTGFDRTFDLDTYRLE